MDECVPVTQASLIRENRHSPVLQPASIGCLRDVPAINVGRGCSFGCVYCYARSYRHAPAGGGVSVYANLAERLCRELDNPRRRKPWPRYVSVNTATDSFQPFEELLEISYRALKALLERGIGVSLLTKGWIPPEFIELFAAHPDHVFIKIGLNSLREDLWKLSEPRAASPQQRLDNLSRLAQAGIRQGVRIDPLLPGLSDQAEDLQALFRALASRGIRAVSLSYLVLRPAILHQLRQELPPAHAQRITAHYLGSPWEQVAASHCTQLLPVDRRERAYQKIASLAAGEGIAVEVCRCKNPDLPVGLCDLEGREVFRSVAPGGARQLSLFRG
ncbi:MAG: radical SAM protein [Candidatus Tectomicrobia bacterium]|uniref:Radical SAM protein n=1 Tax=Tectimicrobiota bacterium TaxID=2528274 RepID=A0A932FW50_UNCTE|nr:radical SAM protein [Candidatus Tectomicrobia bacterium]